MDLRGWSKSNAEYGRRLLDSGIAGVRSGREEFLNGEPLAPFVQESVRSAVTPAILGTCIGVLSSCSAFRQRSVPRTILLGAAGALIGMGAGFFWKSRRLTASAAGSALRNIGRVRDERWLVKHPIDYA
jgi:hypothetical protein